MHSIDSMLRPYRMQRWLPLICINATLKRMTIRLLQPFLIAIAASLLITACTPPPPTAPPTPEPTATHTPRPTATPIPEPVLDPDAFWIAADGFSTVVHEVVPNGEARTIPLPLNEGQAASDLIASADGAYLAYLVWNEDGSQHGIASWKLIEPNARLIVQPQEGYRVISMIMAGDDETLIFLQTNGASKPADLRWRLEYAPAGGGSALLIADETSLPGLLWPLPIAWPENGLLYLHASVREGDPIGQGVVSGVFSLDLEKGDIALLTPPEDDIVLDALLSPDGSKIAYTPGEATGESSIVKVHDIETGETTIITPPDGGAAISMAWDASGDLLLDYLPDAENRDSQTWARVEIGADPPWPQTPQDEDRARLFMYAPYQGGVIYTLLPAPGEGWALYVLSEIGENAALHRLPLEKSGEGAPRLVYVP
jgi:hypothetical protein